MTSRRKITVNYLRDKEIRTGNVTGMVKDGGGIARTVVSGRSVRGELRRTGGVAAGFRTAVRSI